MSEPAVENRPETQSAQNGEAGTVNIAISERAAQELRNIMQGENAPNAGLRLGVEPGGCAGYQYSLSLAETAAGDEFITQSSGIRVFVGREHVSKLDGLVVDFVDSPMGSGFHIKNPNAKHTCGCGNTFDA